VADYKVVVGRIVTPGTASAACCVIVQDESVDNGGLRATCSDSKLTPICAPLPGGE
jgi:hypothetical protein